MNLEKELRDLNERVEKDLSLLEFKKFCGEAKRIIPDSELGLSTEEIILSKELLMRIFYKRLSVFETCRYDWESEKFLPNEEELKYLKEYHEDFPLMVDVGFKMLEEQSPHLVDSFKRIRKNAEENNKAIGELLKNDEYRRKAEEKLRELKEEENKKKGEDNSFPPQLSEVEKKIASLQGKVKALEDKEKQIPVSDNSDTSQQQKKEIQRQIEQLKNELKEKEKEKEKEKSQQRNKKDDFPWGIVIASGAVITILLVVIIVLLARNNKNK